ncbi:hypothetical protein [Deinococcus multiflagellatus]|uniref:Uncharacterized protein n=1 Tax=Deinococcus multiflagellatus TaxID=1656887 RepID=A0ABW1ZHU8_9DEIO|nr:hypothetical protein [Deinococcus multiflagellatus]MBZ9713115.1 hypothetical protein [Deinococcus multiflagellatus]
MTPVFTPPETWRGGFLELALELGPTDDAQLQKAFEVIWIHPNVQGVYVDRNTEPENQLLFAPSQVTPRSQGTYGVISLPSGVILPFTVLVVRGDGEDWLDIDIPMGAVQHAVGDDELAFYSNGNVSDASPVACVRELEDFLAELASVVFTHVKYRLGLIGWEVSGTQDAQEIREQGIPTVRHVGYVLPEESTLRYYPRTAYPHL